MLGGSRYTTTATGIPNSSSSSSLPDLIASSLNIYVCALKTEYNNNNNIIIIIIIWFLFLLFFINMKKISQRR